MEPETSDSGSMTSGAVAGRGGMGMCWHSLTVFSSFPWINGWRRNTVTLVNILLSIMFTVL